MAISLATFLSNTLTSFLKPSWDFYTGVVIPMRISQPQLEIKTLKAAWMQKPSKQFHRKVVNFLRMARLVTYIFSV